MANGPAAFNPQNAAVLAAVSYIDPSDPAAQQLTDMTTALGNTSLPTAGQWQIVWGPVDLGGNLMAIAQFQGAGAAEGGSEVAVVIRGTIFDFPSDLLQDTEVATQVPLPFPPPKGFAEKAAISFGAAGAWMNLASMIPSVGSSSVDAFQFLKSLPGPVSVLVTGHSLGGQLATVAAPWIAGFLPSAAVQVITFAAPTAGNPDFRKSFDSHFSGTAVRYFTDLDIVPRLWVPTGDYDLDSIKQLFPGGPQCDLGCHTGVATAEGIVQNVTYAQPTAAQMLTSAVYSEGLLGAFDDEASAQHRMLLYLYLLGTSAAVIQQVFDSSWSPPPGV
jgi:lipase (class 3)